MGKKESSSKNIRKRRPFKLDIPDLAPGDEHPELMKVQTFLNRLGYLVEAYEPARLDEPTQAGLKRFQGFRKLEQTGRPDETTVRLIERPRCGNPDLTDLDLLAFEEFSLEELAFTLKIGCDYRPATTLTYSFDNRTSQLSLDEVNQAISNAFATWQAAILLDFVFADGDSNANFKLGWFTGPHEDTEPFDNARGLIAHAFYPPKCGKQHAGRCHFDGDEKWRIGHNATLRRFDLETVALHEIGHLLGLKHSNDSTSIMFPDYIFADDVKERRRLSPDVVPIIQDIYGKRNPA